jgi:hypothetical protein
MALVNSRRYSVRNLQRQGDVQIVDFTARDMPAYNAAISELCRFKANSCCKFSWYSWNSPFPAFQNIFGGLYFLLRSALYICVYVSAKYN